MKAIIPARIGSKELPRKNLREINGINLVQHAINFARTVGLDPVVHTDSKEIIESVINSEYILTENKALHTDECTGMEIWDDALTYYKNDLSEYSVFLEPTSPLRHPEDYLKCWEKIKPGYIVGTVSPCTRPHKSMEINNGLLYREGFNSNRHDHKKAYKFNGVCYIRHKTHTGGLLDNCIPVILKRTLVNIDTLEDLKLARLLYENKDRL